MVTPMAATVDTVSTFLPACQSTVLAIASTVDTVTAIPVTLATAHSSLVHRVRTGAGQTG